MWTPLKALSGIEEKVGRTFECTGDHFLNITPAAQTLRETINKWDLLKLKSFYKAKDTDNKTNNSLQNGKRSSLTPHQTEVLSPKYTKNSRNWSPKIT